MLSDADRAVIKSQIAALGFVKLVASVLTLYYFPSWHAVLIVAVLSLPWLVVGGYYLGRTSWFRYRFWKYRHLRQRLLQEEWNVDEDTSEAVSGDRQQNS
ncbi:hypothetical protein BH23CHL2_BH23CHL2_25050 [soil metagenome]